MAIDLAVVMPVYNEDACIVHVVRSWCLVLSDLKINFRLLVFNDGSTDNTQEALSIFKNDSRIEIINKENSGHGPTILMGYKKAVEIAQWVFQCDSDDEMKAEFFPLLWEKRIQFDALFGMRAGREQNISRKIISACSRITIRFLFGTGVSDVNTAYRLMRAPILKQVIQTIPDDTFAPNVIISGCCSKAGIRIFEYPIPMESRKTGNVSIVKWKLWKVAIKSFIQTLCCHPVINISKEQTYDTSSDYNE